MMSGLFQIDFRIFMQAMVDLMSGLDPYVVRPEGGFYSPPWIFYLLWIFHPLPIAWGWIPWFWLNVFATTVAISQAMGKRRYKVIWVVLLTVSPITWPMMFWGNVVGIAMLGIIGLFKWRRPWLAVPLALLKPQLAAVALFAWIIRVKREEILRALITLIALNLPLFVWRPSLYPAFVHRALSGAYYDVQGQYVNGLFSELGVGSPVWRAATMIVMLLMLIIVWHNRNARVAIASSLVADPVPSGGDYGILAAVAAMQRLTFWTVPVILLAAFACPLISLLSPDLYMMGPLAAIVLWFYSILSRGSDETRK